MKLLIKNGHVVDPANNIDEIRDILVEDSKISKVAKDINEKTEKIIDATGKIVMPGIVDMHVHLREPGREDKETISTGTKAALKGGVTSSLAMPNTQPAMDCAGSVKLLKDIIKRSAVSNVFIAGSITKGRLGRELVDIAKLKKEGVIAISDDGASVDDEKILLKALKEAKKNRVLVISHCEDKTLSKNGVVNLGIISTRLGLRGIPKESEYNRVKRDIGLAEKADAAIHIAHVSVKESVQLLAKAKKKGIRVSGETAPHYFYYSQDAILSYDTNMKVNPPLRTNEDIDAVKQGLRDGTIDCIASDHAPHTENEKMVEFDRAEFGSIGLETELAASNLVLVERGLLTWPQLVEKLSVNPAKILNIDKGTLTKGKDADIIIVSPDKEWQVEKGAIVSKSKNSCFLGKKLKGVVEYTICAGKVVYMNADKRQSDANSR